MTLRDYKNTVLATLLKAKNKSLYSMFSDNNALSLSTAYFILSHLQLGFVVLPLLDTPELIIAIPDVDSAVACSYLLLLLLLRDEPSLDPSVSVAVSPTLRFPLLLVVDSLEFYLYRMQELHSGVKKSEGLYNPSSTLARYERSSTFFWMFFIFA